MSRVSAASSTGSAACERLLETLEAETAAIFGNRDRIEAACAGLAADVECFAEPALAARLPLLGRAIAGRVATADASIVDLLCRIAGGLSDPWPVLESLLDSQDARVVAAALGTLAAAAAERPHLVDERAVDALAARADSGTGPFAERAILDSVAALLRAPPSCEDRRLETLVTSAPSPRVSRLAARLLDLGGSLPPPERVRRILGDEAATWLAPYLAWTRATHLDVLALATGARTEALESLRSAEKICGARLLRSLIGEIGWAHLNFGLDVRRVVGTSIAGSFPLLMDASEAVLLDACPGSRRVFERFLVVARGGVAPGSSSSQQAPIARFREYNLAHADLLAGFLDVGPLTVGKVRSVLEQMDRVVEDFQILFASHTDECPTLAGVYGNLKASIDRALAAESPETGKPVSAELTRLVDMFEDPHSLGSVRTLHGLKRYLHQRGLKLGMRLAESGGSANRTITLALANRERVLRTSHVVEYADFEAERGEGDTTPYAVRLLVEEFGRQLAHAQQPLPKVKVFCYGNEVHYFIAYRNHPAFVRIDFSPPARGGMIDLAYFGVSKYELAAHPNPSLTALERFFRRLDFDIQIENTRVQARYDKERAFDLADLCGKAAILFRLAPCLMELDWLIGDLALPPTARDEVAAAWADFFASWGILPHPQFLTRDRRGILLGVESGATGECELRWTGSEPYRDRFSGGDPEIFWRHLRSAVESRKLERILPLEGDSALTQLSFEQRVLAPLRGARARGEIAAVGGDYAPAPPELFEQRHPAACIADVLMGGEETVVPSARVADLVAMLARGLRFRTVGAINGYDVQRASLSLTGGALGLYALRDASGIVRLALWAHGDSLFARRDDPAAPWRANGSVDVEGLERLLRRANYPALLIAAGESPSATLARIEASFRSENPHASSPPLPAERVVDGVAASPGRAVGLARLGLENRRPADVAGSLVICPSLTPQDGIFLSASAGVVSTGGGALSHAGLLALQYGKPALLVSGTWERSGGMLSALAYRFVRYDERRRRAGPWLVTERHHLRERDEKLREGDLVVLDADEGLMRILGQEPAALALHESLRELAVASRRLGGAVSDPTILVERGRRLRARHQLEKVIARLVDPILARHAVTELLIGNAAAEDGMPAAERGTLLALLAKNRAAGAAAQDAARIVIETTRRRLAAAVDEAVRFIPASRSAWEVLALRLDVRRLAGVLGATNDMIAASGLGIDRLDASFDADIESIAARRVAELREQLVDSATCAVSSLDPRLRHRLEELDRVDRVSGTGPDGRAAADRLRASIADQDRILLRRIAGSRILDASAGGIELRPLVGSKAANLAQAARLGEGDLVPPWFVVTDCAFREAFEAPVIDPANPSLRQQSVREAVEAALEKPDLTIAQKASRIREAWEAAQLPEALVDDVKVAYRRLGGGVQPLEEPFVAVRSSATEEDLEVANRAGEFDTFLFVRGETALITHLKRAWAGLWTERALHSRAILGLGGEVGGGILVQKMISSRASGVLHTVNVAGRRLREMVVNAGLGLGEGIVSGTVASDTIVVSKESGPGEELHFRYLTADKRQRVVFNSRLGSGTALVETLHHQRLRPALEYVELLELVRAAARLEAAYGYPLDIEFAVEGTALYLLQVRPIPTPFAVWRDTLERWPLAALEATDVGTEARVTAAEEVE